MASAPIYVIEWFFHQVPPNVGLRDIRLYWDRDEHSHIIVEWHTPSGRPAGGAKHFSDRKTEAQVWLPLPGYQPGDYDPNPKGFRIQMDASWYWGEGSNRHRFHMPKIVQLRRNNGLTVHFYTGANDPGANTILEINYDRVVPKEYCIPAKASKFFELK